MSFLSASQYINPAIPATLPTYVPSSEPTAVKSIAWVRQNPYGKIDDPVNAVKNSKQVSVPHAHTNHDVMEFLADPKSITNPQAKIVLSLPTSEIIVIPAAGSIGLLVRLTSGPIAGKINALYIVSNHKECGHTTIQKSCTKCNDAIVTVNSSPPEHILPGQTVDDFWSIYRNIEIVAIADYKDVEHLTIARQRSAGHKDQYWRPK